MIAGKLHGHLEPHEYRHVMLPTLVLLAWTRCWSQRSCAGPAEGLDLDSPGAERLLRRAAGRVLPVKVPTCG